MNDKIAELEAKCDQYQAKLTEVWSEVAALRAENERLRTELLGLAPTVGSTWMWEPLKPAVSCKALVTDGHWNGEEVWVESEGSNDQRVWNELSRWVEATVLLDPGPDA